MKKKLMKLAQKYIETEENRKFLQSSYCANEESVNCILNMMVEFHLKMSEKGKNEKIQAK